MQPNPLAAGFSTERLSFLTQHINGYVDDGRLPFVACRIVRHGVPAYQHLYGRMDVERDRPAQDDMVLRLYSMTKPIVSVAAMQLFEQGKFLLDDPISRYIPELAKPQVFVGGTPEKPKTRPAASEVTIQQLFTHTSGYTYGFIEDNQVAKIYLKDKVTAPGAKYDLAEFCRRLGQTPLVADPGTEWNYSVSIDVLGRLVEVLSGKTLDVYLQEHIFNPLEMNDTGFYVREDQIDRFTACYERDENGKLKLQDDPSESRYLSVPQIFSGGGGLVGTIADYLKFAEMLCNDGSLNGARILGSRTVEYMSTNHLPGDMAAMGQPAFSESSYEGIGYGLGMSVMLEPAKAKLMTSVGEFGWGGMASTVFWVDPMEDMCVVFCTQLMPSSTYPIRRELRSLIYQAMED